jgi:hypothetical protein
MKAGDAKAQSRKEFQMDDELLMHLHQKFACLLANQFNVSSCRAGGSADFQIGMARRTQIHF